MDRGVLNLSSDSLDFSVALHCKTNCNFSPLGFKAVSVDRRVWNASSDFLGFFISLHC